MSPNNVGKRSPNSGSFKKGDPRCNRNGQISGKRLAFNRTLRELIVAEGEAVQTGKAGDQILKLKKVEWLIKSVWNKAIEGEAWAVEFIAERTEGKVTQPIEAEQNIVYRVIYEKPRDKEKVDAIG
jgi:hypothetical protein